MWTDKTSPKLQSFTVTDRNNLTNHLPFGQYEVYTIPCVGPPTKREREREKGMYWWSHENINISPWEHKHYVNRITGVDIPNVIHCVSPSLVVGLFKQWPSCKGFDVEFCESPQARVLSKSEKKLGCLLKARLGSAYLGISVGDYWEHSSHTMLRNFSP